MNEAASSAKRKVQVLIVDDSAVIRQALVEKIPVVSRDIGGYNARRVYFRTDTGDVYLKKVPSLKLSIIAARESHYRKRAESEVRRAGNVVLFIDPSRDLDA